LVEFFSIFQNYLFCFFVALILLPIGNLMVRNFHLHQSCQLICLLVFPPYQTKNSQTISIYRKLLCLFRRTSYRIGALGFGGLGGLGRLRGLFTWPWCHRVGVCFRPLGGHGSRRRALRKEERGEEEGHAEERLCGEGQAGGRLYGEAEEHAEEQLCGEGDGHAEKD
jgi:hypothetical protein